MNRERIQRTKLNIVTTLLKQVVTALCGLLIPRIMITTFGSVIYGATISISQFLSYISLLEGGIGRVARAALYSPLSENNLDKVSGIYFAVKSFFTKIGIIYVIYTLIIAIVYYDLVEITGADRKFVFLLVIVISLSSIANYLWGFSNMELLHADQRQYITNIIISITYVFNVIMIFLLVSLNANVIVVKLISSLVFILRPILYSYFVKKNFNLSKTNKDMDSLNQRYSGIGQHIAYFIHMNADVILLTVFADLKYVAVYSVYHLVVYNIWNIASSFSGGMEALLGEMIAKNETKSLVQSYNYYKALFVYVTWVLFGCAAVLIIPFVKLYTSGITDVNYIQPAFGIILLLAEGMNCLSIPCCTLPISSNKIKDTKWGAYGEAVLNISISLLLIKWNPLLGVAIGTLVASFVKSIYYMTYSTKEILNISCKKTYITHLITIIVLFVLGLVGVIFTKYIKIKNYLVWAVWGCVVFIIVSVLAFMFLSVFYKREVKMIISKIVKKFKMC